MMDNIREKLVELMEYARQMAKAECNRYKNCVGCRVRDYRKDDICQDMLLADHLLANGVTIQKHGKWERVSLDDQYEGCYKCSACGTEHFFFSDYPSYDDGTYCPCCGCKMEGDFR